MDDEMATTLDAVLQGLRPSVAGIVMWAVDNARREALEEAAKLCEDFSEDVKDRDGRYDYSPAKILAVYIRALIDAPA